MPASAFSGRYALLGTAPINNWAKQPGKGLHICTERGHLKKNSICSGAPHCTGRDPVRSARQADSSPCQSFCLPLSFTNVPTRRLFIQLSLCFTNMCHVTRTPLSCCLKSTRYSLACPDGMSKKNADRRNGMLARCVILNLPANK